uniref:G_PROTEIN_RECEP_F1_2 domain-containing protein n=1 Tax=Steinernema glaseri TaxID=37863 RepID=A0A1I7YMI2_9BILA
MDTLSDALLAADKTISTNTIYFVLRMSFLLIGMAANCIILIPSVFHHSFRKDGFKNILTQLALGDLLTATGTCARLIIHYRNDISISLLECNLVEAIQTTGLYFSQFAIVYVVMDRYIAVRRPLLYHKMVSVAYY